MGQFVLVQDSKTFCKTGQEMQWIYWLEWLQGKLLHIQKVQQIFLMCLCACKKNSVALDLLTDAAIDIYFLHGKKLVALD